MGGHLQQPRVVSNDVTGYDDARSTNIKSSAAAITMSDWRVDGNSSFQSASP